MHQDMLRLQLNNSISLLIKNPFFQKELSCSLNNFSNMFWVYGIQITVSEIFY